MQRLADFHEVLYLEPGVDSVFLKKKPRFFLERNEYCKNLPDSLITVVPRLLSWENRLSMVLRPINRFRVVRQLKMALMDFGKPDVFWLFRPQDYWLASHVSHERLFYHRTDKYHTMPFNVQAAANTKKFRALEKSVVRQADAVFCTSPPLHEDSIRLNKMSYYLPNVADIKHFAIANSPDTAIPKDIAGLPKPIIGFFGAINSFKLDYGFIDAAARATQGSLVMIGPVGGHGGPVEDKPPDNRNIYYLGTRPYAELPAYLKAFDVCLIPLKVSPYSEGVSPLKFFEYLCAGKPVVSLPIPALEAFSDMYYPARTPREWERAISVALREDTPSLRAARKEYSSSFSWENRIALFNRIIDDAASIR